MPPFRFLKREIRASLAEVDTLCLQLRCLLADENLISARERFAVELLAREALSNAVRHGCRENESKRVIFECRLGSLSTILSVTDEGPGFDWRSCLLSPPDDEATHGRGLALYQMYASRILFNPCGNRILLIRPFQERS